MNSRGVIYYNRGQKMLVRLAVSLYSLRKSYAGNVTVLSQGEDSHKPCRDICGEFGATLQHVEYETPPGARDTYLNATLSHKKTPYDVTVWLDSDTVVLRPFDALWDAAEKNEFAIAQFSTWGTSGGKIAGRIKSWKPLYPEFVGAALKFGHAINCGVFAFRKDSGLMRDWYRLAEPGRDLSWIPDETCCQLILPQHKNQIMPAEYNVSCKYGVRENARIIHYHGRKHCRREREKYLFMSDIWYGFFDDIADLKFVKKYMPKDRQLVKALKNEK